MSMVALTAKPAALFDDCVKDEGTWLGHVLEHVVLELQGVAGMDVTFGRTRIG